MCMLKTLMKFLSRSGGEKEFGRRGAKGYGSYTPHCGTGFDELSFIWKNLTEPAGRRGLRVRRRGGTTSGVKGKGICFYPSSICFHLGYSEPELWINAHFLGRERPNAER
ncbi:hypothetical protein CC1G_15008 [Coprinopsis cinerea okayama7|uniref:Uncharacterized protein n=1 Tax=Coprinopsis cinerea (strain Okayama-7 / 130 / ATCC MYA-4618 / FGSC 9003) TaxID=240176 RepID=D6RP60_COPC7|nr:hypothetical protein CC1G_15008 [Coprinopsis cinerea okayama7\|eukprot:XP_002910677.1 hypothetical protein CC1G_15008 [Coprinopsis cinerea okayama7\